MTDAEWLRERPEIAEPFAAELQAWMRRANRSLTGVSSDELLTAILPLLRAAIRADVVRELAGYRASVDYVSGAYDFLCSLGAVSTSNLHRANNFALEQRAAAHAQGRAAGREPLIDVLASLVAAVSLLKAGGKKAAPSDKMFEQMIRDYEKSIEAGRAAIRSPP